MALRNWIYTPGLYALTGLAAGSLCLWGLLLFYPNVEWAQSISFVAPAAGALALLSWVVAQPLWWLSSRNRTRFSFICPLLFCCGAIVILLEAREEQYQYDFEKAQQIDDIRQRMRIANARRAADALEEWQKRQEQMEEDRFLQYEGRVDAAQLDAIRKVDQEMVAELNEQAESYSQLIDNKNARGPESWIRFETVDAFENEITAYAEIYAKTRTFLQFLEDFEQRYQAKLDELNLVPPADRIAAAELQRVMLFLEISGTMEVRRLDVELNAETLKVLNFLRDNWGAWRFERSRQRIEFAHPAMEEEFSYLMMDLQMILEALDKRS